MGRAIGIDLGTTNSVVAILDGGRPMVVVNSEGDKTTPSVVLYPPDGGDPVVGQLARRQEQTARTRVVRSVKRLMGARVDESAEVNLPCQVALAESEEGDVLIDLGDEKLRPEQVSAEILMRMCQTAEEYLEEKVEEAVITVPAYFNDSQRKATKDAGEIAGLQVIRIVNEPTSAALAYGLGRGTTERVAVFDFGGGTFDISILDIDEDVFEVLSTNGDTYLGGDNIDEALTTFICGAITKETGIDPRGSGESLQRVRETAEKVKCELSTLESTVISLPFIVSDEAGPKHFDHEIRRDEFEAMIAPVLARLAQPCRMALNDANLTPDDIDTVLLVGGSTRIPAVQKVAKDIFGKEPSKAVNPDEAVALGAAIQASVLTGDIQEVLLLDVTPLSLGIEIQNGVFSTLIPRNSTIPVSVDKTFTTVRDNQKAVKVHVLQGERRQASENRTLARFRLTDIDPAPREIPQISVNFTIDANGILNVSAQDLSSGVRNEVTVESYVTESTGENAEKAVLDAESAVEEDRAFMMLARVRSRAAGAAETVRAFMENYNGQLSEEKEKMVRERLMSLDVVLHGTDVSAIDTAEKNLRALSQEVDDLIFLDRLV